MKNNIIWLRNVISQLLYENDYNFIIKLGLHRVDLSKIAKYLNNCDILIITFKFIDWVLVIQKCKKSVALIQGSRIRFNQMENVKIIPISEVEI